MYGSYAYRFSPIVVHHYLAIVETKAVDGRYVTYVLDEAVVDLKRNKPFKRGGYVGKKKEGWREWYFVSCTNRVNTSTES